MNFVRILIRGRLPRLFTVFIFSINFVLMNNDIYGANDYESVDNQFSQFRNQIINEINKQRTSYNEDLRILKQQGNTCGNEIQSLSEVIQDLTTQISQMKRKINHLEKENAKLNTKLNNDIGKFGTLLDNERKIRQKADLDIIKEVSVEIASSSRWSERRLSALASAPSTSKTYRLYEVEKGDTLGAVAKAFNISLKRLKMLNGLNNDTIYIGQKLKVP